jgi:hypothetical protein
MIKMKSLSAQMMGTTMKKMTMVVKMKVGEMKKTMVTTTEEGYNLKRKRSKRKLKRDFTSAKLSTDLSDGSELALLKIQLINTRNSLMNTTKEWILENHITETLITLTLAMTNPWHLISRPLALLV